MICVADYKEAGVFRRRVFQPFSQACAPLEMANVRGLIRFKKQQISQEKKAAPFGEGGGSYSARGARREAPRAIGRVNAGSRRGLAFPSVWSELFQSRFSRASLGEEFLLTDQTCLL
jgi:hypothetical protein